MFKQITGVIENLSDDRTKESFLASSPLPTLVLIGAYLVTATLVLPAYMKARPAFRVDTAIYYYNIFQVLLSAYIVYLTEELARSVVQRPNVYNWLIVFFLFTSFYIMRFLLVMCIGYGSGWVRRFSIFKCREIDRNPRDPDAVMAMDAIYLYFLAKFSEFPDTIFFLLRKKYRQVSFLHLYHHASMPMNAWLLLRFVPGGTSTIAVATNSSIHVVMYSYYLLSGLGPHWQKHLWWKKYLTAFQLVQFAFGLYQISLVLFGDCVTFKPHKPLFTFYLLYVASLLVLFSKFYRDSYHKKLSKTGLNKNGVAKPKKIE